ncbi:MAG TPA: gephyrin-like molybdotransferase Glp [Rhizomicrobium sp.]|jgi:molybdopterin molybdotransferase
MISVEDAIDRVKCATAPLGPELVPLAEAHGRVLARDAIALLDQPAAPISAMDGYAVRLEDARESDISLRIVGTAPAGHPFAGRLGRGEAVRIFTGAVVPEGADGIVIQEDVTVADRNVTIRTPASPRHIRPAGLDFRNGSVLARAGRKLAARDLALLAAGNLASVEVRRKPIVAFASTGDELVLPGTPPRPGSIVASSGYALSALIAAWGGEPLDLGIFPDTVEALQRLPDAASRADAVVTTGGASVGDHDLVQHALAPKGFALDFWKIAMRPGKPLIFGRLRDKPFLGLPGNPVSSHVCALLFLKPLIAAFLGMHMGDERIPARLTSPVPANDSRQDYLRARLIRRDRELWTEPFPIQDSSMQSILASADALIVRPPGAPAAETGQRVEVIPLDREFAPE